MEDVVKVNIGCGPQSKSDWINLDYGMVSFLSQFPWLFKLLVNLHILSDFRYLNIPRIHNCAKNLPFKDVTVDFIYASHFVEHLYRHEVVKFISECKRVLRKEGVLRIAVPDLKILAEKYINDDNGFFFSYFGIKENTISGNITDLFAATFFSLEEGSKTKPNFIKRVKNKLTRGHHWMYDFESLKKMLIDAGFSAVKHCNIKEGKVPDIDFLDNFPLGLYLEAYP